MSLMKPLPDPEVYDKTLAFWPYKATLEEALKQVATHAPHGAHVLDVMCGPGYFLGQLHEQRPDLNLSGVDVEERYVDHARGSYPDITFKQADVLEWRPPHPYPVVICTGSIHHLRYEQQDAGIRSIAAMVERGGVAIISDVYVRHYHDEMSRRHAAAELGHEYLKCTIAAGAPHDVLEWTMDVTHNDVLMHEYKTSLRQGLALLRKHFAHVAPIKTWPVMDSEYGEWVHVCTH